MNAYNSVTTAIFDVLLAPFGQGTWGTAAAIVAWSVISGLVALYVYKYASNQAAIERAKDRIKMHLLEIRLFRHDIGQVLRSTGAILLRNLVYLGHNLVPMVVLLVPFMTVLVQLVANYAYSPAPVGSVAVLEARLSPGSEVPATAVRIELPDGVELDDDCGPPKRAAAPPVPPPASCPPPVVRTADGELFARIRATAPGDHVIRLVAGDEVLEKVWAVGGEPRKVPVMRTRSLEGLLYPGEAGIPSDSHFEHVEIPVPPRSLPLLPDGELGVLLGFFVVSLGAGFALKDVVGVTF